VSFSWRDLVFENGIYKVIALIITMILWVTVLSRRDVILTKAVDVDFVTGDRLVLLNDPRPSVEFRIAGSRIAMKKLENQVIDPLQIDLSSVDPGRRVISIPDNSLVLPLGAKVVGISPSRLTIDLQTIVSRTFVVQPQFDNLDAGFTVLSIEPSRVQVRGAKSALDRVGSVLTEPIVLTLDDSQIGGAGGLFEVDARLESPTYQGITGISPTAVKVRIRLPPQRKPRASNAETK
jgi:YbbR domain-containing protein